MRRTFFFFLLKATETRLHNYCPLESYLAPPWTVTSTTPGTVGLRVPVLVTLRYTEIRINRTRFDGISCLLFANFTSTVTYATCQKYSNSSCTPVFVDYRRNRDRNKGVEWYRHQSTVTVWSRHEYNFSKSSARVSHLIDLTNKRIDLPAI